MRPNPELIAIFEADQADRQGALPPDISARDAERRRRVEELLDDGALRAPEDLWRAAFIFQHGDRLEHYWQAHELAMQAVDMGYEQARWISAATYDRWLMHQGLPQKFGTQFLRQGGAWRLHEVDPTTDDAERARWNVPPLAEARAYAEQLNRDDQAPPVADAPRQPAERQILAAARLPGLDLVVIALEDQLAGGLAGGLPAPEPLGPEDLAWPLPAYLPPGLVARRLGEGFCAVDSLGELQLTWFELLLPADQPMVFAWHLADGPAPQIFSVDLGGRMAGLVTATWSAVSGNRPPAIVARSGPEYCWLVAGQLPYEELARVIVSLPVQGS